MVYYNLLMVVFDESQRSDCSAETVWVISECQFPRVLNVEVVVRMRTILSIPGYWAEDSSDNIFFEAAEILSTPEELA